MYAADSLVVQQHAGILSVVSTDKIKQIENNITDLWYCPCYTHLSLRLLCLFLDQNLFIQPKEDSLAVNW